jgi:hypothetical protein
MQALGNGIKIRTALPTNPESFDIKEKDFGLHDFFSNSFYFHR